MSALRRIPMYLRIKRQNQTYFILCQPSDTVGFLKEEISIATQGEIKPDQMRLILPPSSSSEDTSNAMADSDVSSLSLTILEDDTEPLEKYNLKNEMALYVVFQISEQEWEPIANYDNGTAGGFGG